jgi:hypothetical protein
MATESLLGNLSPKELLFGLFIFALTVSSQKAQILSKTLSLFLKETLIDIASPQEAKEIINHAWAHP